MRVSAAWSARAVDLDVMALQNKGRLYMPNGVSRSLVLEQKLREIAPGLRLAPCSDCVGPAPGWFAQQALAMTETTDRLRLTNGLQAKVKEHLSARQGEVNGIAPNTNEQRVAMAESLLAYANTQGGRDQLKKVGSKPTVYAVLDPEGPQPRAANTQEVFDYWKDYKGEHAYAPSASLFVEKRLISYQAAFFPNDVDKKVGPYVTSPVLSDLANHGIDVVKGLNPIEEGFLHHHENLHISLEERSGPQPDAHHGQINRVLEHLYLRGNGYTAARSDQTRITTVEQRHMAVFERYGTVHRFLWQALGDLSSVVGTPRFDTQLIDHLSRLPQEARKDAESWFRKELFKAGQHGPSKADLIPK